MNTITTRNGGNRITHGKPLPPNVIETAPDCWEKIGAWARVIALIFAGGCIAMAVFVTFVWPKFA